MGGSALASLFGAKQSSDAAGKAADTQSRTAKENRALSEKYTSLSLGDLDAALGGALAQFDQGQQAGAAPLQPYAKAGEGSLAKLADLYGLNGAEGTARGTAGFTTSPGYQFRMDQGVQAIDRSANARGGLYGGGTLKALTDYGQGVASQEYGNYVNGLTGLAQGGQNAAGTLSGLAANTYGSKANALLGNGAARAQTRAAGLAGITDANAQAGAAQAGGTINQANAWNAGLGNLAQLGMFGAGLNRPQPARAANPFGF